jgi:hypothetical protein
MMIGYDIYDRFTMEHFRLRQSMILTTSFFLLATVHNFYGKKIFKMAAMWTSVTSLNSQKNTLFIDIQFDSPSHLKKNNVSLVSSK